MAAYVRRLGGTNNTTGATIAITVPTSVVAVGNSIVVAVGCNSATLRAFTCADTRSNTYTRDISMSGSPDTWSEYLLSTTVTTQLAVGDTITVTDPTTTDAKWIGVYEVSGLQSPNVVDTTKTGTLATNVTTANSGAATTNVADLIAAIAGFNQQALSPAASGYTVPQEEDSDAGNGDALAAGFKDKPTPASETATFTFSITDSIVGWVGYKASTGTAAITTPAPLRIPNPRVGPMALRRLLRAKIGRGPVAGSGIVQALAGTINGLATVAATVVKTAVLGPTVNGSSAVSATLVKTAVLAPAVNGKSTVSATVVKTAVLRPTVNGSTTVTGSLVATKVLSGTVNGSSSVSAAVVATHVLTPAVNGRTTVTGSLVATHVLTATANGSSFVTATVTNTSTPAATGATAPPLAISIYYHR